VIRELELPICQYSVSERQLFRICYIIPHLATYDVQGAEIYGGIGTISIWCLFAPGSQAKGCHVEIGKTAIRINVPRLSGDPPLQTAEQTVIDITPGSYAVLIFDWERDGSFSSTPSYVDHVNVTGPDVLTSSMPPTIGRLLYRTELVELNLMHSNKSYWSN